MKTLAQCLASWLQSQNSDMTRKTYAISLDQCLDYWTSISVTFNYPSEIKREHCQMWYQHCTVKYGERRHSGQSINVKQTAMAKYIALSSFLQHCYEMNEIPRHPGRGILRHSRTLGNPRRAIPAELAQKILLHGVFKMSWGRHASMPQRRNGEIFRISSIILMATGIRIGELCSLKVEHFEPKSETNQVPRLLILGKGNKINRIVLAPEIAEAISKHIKNNNLPRDYEICRVPGLKRLSQGTFSAWLGRICEDLKVPRVSTHQFRATLATELHLSNVPLGEIQRLMGHKNPQTTARYVHLVDEVRQAPGLRVKLVPKKLLTETPVN